MTPEQLKRMFPNASRSTLEANSDRSQLQEREERTRGEERDMAPDRPKLERRPADGAVGEAKEKTGDRPRFFVRVTSVRHRLIDEDNLCEKYAIDLCRYSGILPEDGPGETRIQATQRKAGKEEQEHTVIEVFEIAGVEFQPDLFLQ